MLNVETPRCIWCGDKGVISVTFVDHERIRMWRIGIMPIQEALPAWSSTNREQLISGTHPACFTDIFGKEDK